MGFQTIASYIIAILLAFAIMFYEKLAKADHQATSQVIYRNFEENLRPKNHDTTNERLQEILVF